MSRAAAAATVARAVAADEELLIHPHLLAAVDSRFGSIQVMPKRGRHDDEMTVFRYDAILRVGTTRPRPVREWHDWQIENLTLEALPALLRDGVGVRNIPNRRISRALRISAALRATEGPVSLTGVRAMTAPAGVDPEVLFPLGAVGSLDGGLTLEVVAGADLPAPTAGEPCANEPVIARRVRLADAGAAPRGLS
jgi:hypothetical protein